MLPRRSAGGTFGPMLVPHLLAQVQYQTPISHDSTITVGFAVLLIGAILGLAESRWHVASLREARKASDARVDALEQRLAQQEAKGDRTNLRVDHLLELLTEVRSDVKTLLRGHGRDAA